MLMPWRLPRRLTRFLAAAGGVVELAHPPHLQSRIRTTKNPRAVARAWAFYFSWNLADCALDMGGKSRGGSTSDRHDARHYVAGAWSQSLARRQRPIPRAMWPGLEGAERRAGCRRVWLQPNRRWRPGTPCRDAPDARGSATPDKGPVAWRLPALPKAEARRDSVHSNSTSLPIGFPC